MLKLGLRLAPGVAVQRERAALHQIIRELKANLLKVKLMVAADA